MFQTQSAAGAAYVRCSGKMNSLFTFDKLKGRSPLASAAIATLASIIFAWKKDYVMRALITSDRTNGIA